MSSVYRNGTLILLSPRNQSQAPNILIIGSNQSLRFPRALPHHGVISSPTPTQPRVSSASLPVRGGVPYKTRTRKIETKTGTVR
ncbi:hypothetical protein BgiBS90_033567, partial [Biomphalaria glabrata]